jgi:hypothetical protein
MLGASAMKRATAPRVAKTSERDLTVGIAASFPDPVAGVRKTMPACKATPVPHTFRVG